jgi:hypothetical protein
LDGIFKSNFDYQLVAGDVCRLPREQAALGVFLDGAARCQLNVPNLKHQIEFDWLDDILDKNTRIGETNDYSSRTALTVRRLIWARQLLG